MITDWDRQEKNKIRDIATSRSIYERKILSKVALMLPGIQLKCVKQAIANGIIKPNHTFLWAVEHDRANVKIIDRGLKRLGWKSGCYHLHVGELYNLVLPRDTKIDFAFIDLCGAMTAKIARWLYDNQFKFASCSRLGMTFGANIRRPDFVQNMDRYITDKLRARCLSNVSNATNNWLYKSFGYVNGSATKKNQLVGWNNVRQNVTNTWVAVACALSNTSFRLNHSMVYKEEGRATTMHYLEIRFNDHHFDEGEAPSDITNIIQNLVPPLKRPLTNRTESAKKAWQTRRRNNTKLLTK